MDELLAKPNKKLEEHLLEVYNLGKEIAHTLELKKDLKKRVLIACLLHDVGKAIKNFQIRMNNIKKGQRQKMPVYPHALASLPFILVSENMLFNKPLLASAAVVSHHSPLSPGLYQGWNPPQFCSSVRKVIENLIEKTNEFKNLNTEELYQKALSINNPSIILHKGLLYQFKDLPLKDFAKVQCILHLADWLVSAGKKEISIIFLRNGNKFVLKTTSNLTLRGFQKKLARMKTKPEIRLRAPTGSGKTEGLLLWAGDTKRIIYLLPTQATVNAMWERLSKIYGGENVGIAHGRANYILHQKWEEEHQREEMPLDYRLFASVFAKPVVVATLDQYLMGYMNGRHWEERQTLSENATVIIDEIHCYEPYTLGILKKVFEISKPQRLALASATLSDPLLEIFGYENLIEAEEDLWNRKRHKIKVIDEPLESGLLQAVKVAKLGKKVLVIANTVRKAQKIYEELNKIKKENEAKELNMLLLHSRFIYRDRINKEKDAMKCKFGTILVATQIVEVSLDISYDFLFTELAPIDALIQRMGRINRKGLNPPARVFIYTVVDEGAKRIYHKEILNLSLHLLKKLPEIPTEKELLEITNILYKEIFQTDTFKEEFNQGIQNIERIRKYCGCFTIDLSDEDFRSRFITRKGIFSIDIIPETFLQEAFELLEQEKRWKLVELTLPVPGYWVKIWSQYFYPSEDLGYVITKMEYNSNVGLKVLEKGNQIIESEIW